MRLGALAVVLAGLLAACSYSDQAPPILEGYDPGPAKPGRYAAFVQSGGWTIEPSFKSTECFPNSYVVDINFSWDQTMRHRLKATLANVEFVNRIIPRDQLAESGYAAQIIVTPMQAVSRVYFQPAPSTSIWRKAVLIEVRTTLDGVLVVHRADGVRYEQPLGALGVKSWTAESGIGCAELQPVFLDSSLKAVDSLTRVTVNGARVGLEQPAPRTSSAP